jgi:hypothetical protein
MNQAVELNAVLEGCSTRQDKSLSMRLSSEELSSEEKMLVMELQNVPCLVSFKPLEGFSVTKEIKTELSKKTQSERIRASLFVWWRQLGEPGDFNAFYQSESEKYIDAIKAKLKPL